MEFSIWCVFHFLFSLFFLFGAYSSLTHGHTCTNPNLMSNIFVQKSAAVRIYAIVRVCESLCTDFLFLFRFGSLKSIYIQRIYATFTTFVSIQFFCVYFLAFPFTISNSVYLGLPYNEVDAEHTHTHIDCCMFHIFFGLFSGSYCWWWLANGMSERECVYAFEMGNAKEINKRIA